MSFFNKTKYNVAALLFCRFTKNGLQVTFKSICFKTLISLENFSIIHLLQNVFFFLFFFFCKLSFVYILVHLLCKFSPPIKCRWELGEVQIMRKAFHLRCCKGSVSSSQGFPTLNVAKNIKATFLMFLLFI